MARKHRIKGTTSINLLSDTPLSERRQMLLHVATQGSKANAGKDVDGYIAKLGAGHTHRETTGHLWGKSSEGSTHGFGTLDDVAAKRHYDQLTVGALQRLGVKQAKLK